MVGKKKVGFKNDFFPSNAPKLKIYQDTIKLPWKYHYSTKQQYTIYILLQNTKQLKLQQITSLPISAQISL